MPCLNPINVCVCVCVWRAGGGEGRGYNVHPGIYRHSIYKFMQNAEFFSFLVNALVVNVEASRLVVLSPEEDPRKHEMRKSQVI